MSYVIIFHISLCHVSHFSFISNHTSYIIYNLWIFIIYHKSKSPCIPGGNPLLGAGKQKIYTVQETRALVSHSPSNFAKHNKIVCKSQPDFALCGYILPVAQLFVPGGNNHFGKPMMSRISRTTVAKWASTPTDGSADLQCISQGSSIVSNICKDKFSNHVVFLLFHFF